MMCAITDIGRSLGGAEDGNGSVWSKTCTRCSTTAWHPDVRTCPFGDCPFRAEIPAAANSDSIHFHDAEVSRAAR